MTYHKRESFPHYIGVDKNDEQAMLKELGLNSLDQLFSHLPEDIFLEKMNIENGLAHDKLKQRIQAIADKNNLKTSFLGDGLQDYKVAEIVPKVSAVRGLSTAYTPYQPERSQGTLQTLWLYQNAISEITGFEAINASLYERSTCLYEALNCAVRIKRKTSKVIVAENIYPGDIEVLETQARKTNLEVIYAPIDKNTGLLNHSKLKELLTQNTGHIAALAFTQINCFGSIENFNELNDIAHEHDVLSIAIVDIAALANEGLKEPARWGSDNQGADILVGEGQHLTIAPNFGGPGLGIFGIRYNDKNKNMIRSTAGRFIGKAKDENGRDCKSIILATREQHIRREKATSNICSNQSFIASLCGAALLSRGAEGINDTFKKVHANTLKLMRDLTTFNGVSLFHSTPVYNEFTISIDSSVDDLIKEASLAGIHIGVNVSGRCGVDKELLLISVNDKHSEHDLQLLVNFFGKHFSSVSISETISSIDKKDKRHESFSLPKLSTQDLEDYYKRLGKQNLSPDDGIYPLGSCTMKYNPELNEWAAALRGFTDTHPQAPDYDVQGNLQILFEVQELFKDITGLPGVTTQPLAGAQGELVGLKMFQAYHQNNGEGESRNIILIPRSAHGTNPASATQAGFETKIVDGKKMGIITIEANDHGEINFEQFSSLVQEYSTRIAGVMITNPNTAGIFETKFKNISDLIHSVGGLVYMDGANMNAIAGWVDLDKLGVDAVHNNLHKTWSIPHGGGGPGDAIVAVSSKLIDYLPGVQIKLNDGLYSTYKPKHTMGSIHRHYGNFAHKVRAYTYLKALGADGIKRMSAVAVLNARYLYNKLNKVYPVLPQGSKENPRMHEFILTLSDDSFSKLAAAGTPKSQAIAKVGKLFLDFGFHAPTVAFPEVYGLMLEPTESYSKEELDKFCSVVETIHHVINEFPQTLQTAPHFTPIDKVDELVANKKPILTQKIQSQLDPILKDRVEADLLRNLAPELIIEKIIAAHEEQMK